MRTIEKASTTEWVSEEDWETIVRKVLTVSVGLMKTRPSDIIIGKYSIN